MIPQNSIKNSKFSYEWILTFENPENVENFTLKINSNSEILEKIKENLVFCTENNLKKQNLIATSFSF